MDSFAARENGGNSCGIGIVLGYGYIMGIEIMGIEKEPFRVRL